MASNLSWTAHLAILLAVAAIGAGLSALLRYRKAWGRIMRFSLSGFLATNELIWYGYRLYEEGFRFPEALPLQLCDLTLWLTVAAALTLKPGIYEIDYSVGLAAVAWPCSLLTCGHGSPHIRRCTFSYPMDSW